MIPKVPRKTIFDAISFGEGYEGRYFGRIQNNKEEKWSNYFNE